ncbi:MAG: cupin domain-containing protein [Planctomycetaceae bacterium]
MTNRELGLRLKALRERRKLSLRGLARKTDMALSHLSKIENGKNSISVARLKTILAGLGSSLGEFFQQDRPPRQKIVYRRDELLEVSGKGNGLSLREVAAGRAGRGLQLLHEKYAVGADTGTEMYSHDAEEAGIVLKGTLELTVDDEVHVLKAGDAYYFDSRRPHRVRNIGRGAAEAVSVNTPPSF